MPDQSPIETSEPIALLQMIRQAIIGRHHEIDAPFGRRLVTYADYTASGRSLSFVEDFLRDHVMPYYANTHTESSATGLQTTRFRDDAREIISHALGAGEEDVVIFAGSGATGAIDKLIDILNLRLPADLNDRYHLLEKIPAEDRPVVFIGPYEHHSNELPWRESIADVVVIDEDENGRPDLEELEKTLLKYSARALKIGSFSAASNVTGIGSCVGDLSALLHRHGALAFWDFAAAAPYVQIEMNPKSDDPDNYKDAIFISPHKFIGGPGTPGVLCVKRALLKNRVPTVPGGGTVAYVGPDEHRYLQDPILREEGGTPEILGSIRAGLVFQLKEAVGTNFIRNREDAFVSCAVERWRQHQNLRILGNHNAWRLSIVSFVVHHNSRYLHHNFVVSLLNDLFGIQSRGGCSCAGPYGHRLLRIDATESHAYRREIMRGCEGIKPGWTRINFNYFIDDQIFEFIVSAVEFVAEYGWRFLPLYRFCALSGRWKYSGWPDTGEGPLSWAPRDQMSLHDIRYRDGSLTFPHRHRQAKPSAYEGYLEAAHRAAERARENQSVLLENASRPSLNDDFERLRWFALPGDR